MSIEKEIEASFHTDKSYICPVCYAGFDTRDEKSRHLTDVHGYEILPTYPEE